MAISSEKVLIFITLALVAAFRGSSASTCSRCESRTNKGQSCEFWTQVDCASVYGPKKTVCAFYPSNDKNANRMSVRSMDKQCIPEETLRPVYDISLSGSATCSYWGVKGSPPMCVCVDEACNSSASVQDWLDQYTAPSQARRHRK